jgi:hypothetical protein
MASSTVEQADGRVVTCGARLKSSLALTADKTGREKVSQTPNIMTVNMMNTAEY